MAIQTDQSYIVAYTVSGDVYAQRFDANGAAMATPFRLNNLTTGVQSRWVGSDNNGAFTIYKRETVASWTTVGNYQGASGDDVLFGSTGADTLTGGLGADVFLFQSPADGLDVITDFQPGVDRIEISAAGFDGLPTGQLSTDRFSSNGVMTGDTRFVFNDTTRVLSYDADGSGIGAAVDLVKLNVSTLGSANIFVV